MTLNSYLKSVYERVLETWDDGQPIDLNLVIKSVRLSLEVSALAKHQSYVKASRSLSVSRSCLRVTKDMIDKPIRLQDVQNFRSKIIRRSVAATSIKEKV